LTTPSLTLEQKEQLFELTRHWLAEADNLWSRSFSPLKVRLDLRGLAAGQYRSGPFPLIRYNAEMAAIQFQAFCQRTPPHEVAHHVVHQLHGDRGIRPHGPQWQEVMAAFGVEPSRCHDYRLDNLSRRRQKRYRYCCQCQEHDLSANRHNRVLRGEQTYLCRRCRQPLRPIPRSDQTE